MTTVSEFLKTSYRKYRSELRRYCLLLIAPLLLGAVLLLCVQSVTLRQLDSSGENSVRRFRAEAHGIVHELQIVSNSILADSALLDAAKADQRPDDPLAVSFTIQRHLDKSSFVSDVYLISKKQNCIYSRNAYFTYDALSTILDDFTGENIESLSNPENLGWHILNTNYTAPYYLAAFPDGDAILLVTLNKTAFIRTFFNNGTVVCSMFNENFSISNRLINTPNIDWYSENDVSVIAGEKVKCFYFEQDGYTYMTALSRSEFNGPVKIILAVFAIYFVLVLVFGVFYILWVSKKRYNDVVAMIGDLPNNVGKDTSYEELVGAMRSSLEEYKQHYNNQLRFQRRNQLIPFLTGARSSFPDEALEKTGLRKAEHGYYVAIIHFAEGIGVAHSSPPQNNIDLTCTLLYSALSKAAGEHMGIAVSHLDHNYAAVISVLSPVVTREDIRFILDETVLAAESEYGSKLLAFAAGPVDEAGKIYEAYKAASSLYSFANSAGSDATVLLQSDMESDTGNLLTGDFAKQLQLISATMQLEKYDMVPQLVEAILQEHVANLGTHYALSHSRISAVANLLVEAAASSPIPKESAAVYIRSLQQAENINTLNRLAAEICTALQELAASNESHDIVSKACTFIEQHLSAPNLSVPDVSEAMGISVQHLSRLFRKKMNITVVEQINTARIDLAKKLILQDGMTVNKVAEAVGYSNNVTFTRNFRRYVGMAPSEYREISKN